MKKYMIFGASSGIGEACAKRLSQDADLLFLVGRDEERLKKVSLELECESVRVKYDLKDLENIKDIFEECRQKGIKLDGVVYSAGVNADCPIKSNSIALMQEAMTVNCFAFLEMGKHFYNKAVSNDGACIIAISSISSILCDKGMAPYSASKAALNAVVKTMAKEFSRRKFRVNAILPAGVDTPMARKKMSVLNGITGNKDGNACDGGQYMGIIPPSVIAENVAFLLSDTGKYTTGELQVVGGGLVY